MILLAMDTSGPVCGIAITEDGEIRYEAVVKNNFTHSRNLMPMVEEACVRSGIPVEKADMFACTVGPGSFTGVRLGVEAAKALGHALSRPVVPVDALEAFAEGHRGFDGLILPMQDARAKQVYDWLHVKGVRSFDGMTNLSKALRDKLRSVSRITVLRPVQVLTSQTDGTKKYLFALSDGNIIESVMMRYSYGISVCISSQVGCRMGCRFCASTIGGRIRNLTAAEMLSQVTEIQRIQNERVSHVVVMGSGEPFDNYEELVRFLRLIGDEKGENLSLRNITVSTCGLVPEIRRFAEEGLPVTLALSLHASSQKEREILMPVAKKYELGEVLDAMRCYFSRTGRRITFEYSCVQGVNTSSADADRLKNLLRGMKKVG